MTGLFGQKAELKSQPQAGEQPGPLIKEGSTESFGADVIAESARQPVLVDFWAPWCEPCKQLAPILEKVVKAAGGKVKLVKLNIDEYPQIPARLGVRSIPAVIAFQRAQPVDGFMGALPDSEVRGFIERLAGPIGKDEDLHAEAEALLAAGDSEGAVDVYMGIIAEDPGDFAAAAALAKIFAASGDIEGAKAVLASVPPDGERDAAIIAARAAVDLAEQAASLGDAVELARAIEADPADYQARFDLAIALNGRNRRDEAASALFEIIKRDRAWNDDGARKQLLQFFEAWGPTDPATIGARKKLSSLLFS
ncbi:thioredoxin family protein [Methylocapsa palsarum]|uniref:Putative thioredoxin n=1 Tax=Methylocapsa palsarum TaxID=1612308 RepID=A0A1I3YPG6_9HYPH|nr:co-chaperone YbbN [Methylocapsa palsarum]SFK33673.1 putative thioredoxin [Methylocapsa palsarum]